MSFLHKYAVYIILGISILTVGGSMYVGNFGDPVSNWFAGQMRNTSNAIIPCNMCRYIRIATYPILLISILQIYYRQNYSKVILWLAIIGLGLCIYKYTLEMGYDIGSASSVVCSDSATDCSQAHPLYFGFVSLALLGIVSNTVVAYLACTNKQSS